MSPVPPASPAGDVGQAEAPQRPMGAIYVAVLLVEIVTLLALWWFQSTFSRG